MNFCDEHEKFKEVYAKAIEFLHKSKPDGLTVEQMEKYFQVPDIFRTKNKIFERLCGTLQNYQSMPNVIGFYTKKERAKIFRKIFCDYDDRKVLEKYGGYEEILDVFTKEFKLDRETFARRNNSWVKYAKAVFSASKFMSQFKDAEDFNHFVGLFSYNEATAVALPLLLSREIYGMGFALGCDFLKEIGYAQYPKPDVHLIGIFSALGLSLDDELDCYKAIIRMAKAVNETPFKVDKVFWLIGSGNFNSDVYEGEIKRRREEFIKYCL